MMDIAVYMSVSEGQPKASFTQVYSMLMTYTLPYQATSYTIETQLHILELELEMTIVAITTFQNLVKAV